MVVENHVLHVADVNGCIPVQSAARARVIGVGAVCHHLKTETFALFAGIRPE